MTIGNELRSIDTASCQQSDIDDDHDDDKRRYTTALKKLHTKCCKKILFQTIAIMIGTQSRRIDVYDVTEEEAKL